jgi:N-acetylglutamate synthase-like GNAT family acetyltransferase
MELAIRPISPFRPPVLDDPDKPGRNAIGERLVQECKQFAVEMGWTRLEVTTPPLPEFDHTLRFYENRGFAITGGRKLKHSIG